MSEDKNAVTHNGVFHPDDVFSAVVLEKYILALKSRVRVIRRRLMQRILFLTLVVCMTPPYRALITISRAYL